MEKILIIAGILIIALLSVATIMTFRIVSPEEITGNIIADNNWEKLTLKVSIPCGGHASIIKNELNKLDGVEKIEYTPITTFVVYYDSTKITEQDILNQNIFKDYLAKKIN